MSKFERYFFGKTKQLFDKNNFIDNIHVWEDNGINIFMKINENVYYFEKEKNFKILITKNRWIDITNVDWNSLNDKSRDD